MREKIHTAVALFDMHIRTHPTDLKKCGWEPRISKALLAALKFCDDFKPDRTILGGDILDLPEISRFTERKKIQRERLRLNHTFDCVNQILDRVDKFTKKKVFYLKGNHEAWLDMWIEENPALQGLISLEKNLRLHERNYKVIPENKVLKIGHARFIHGWFYNVHHSKKTVNAMGDNVFYGHTHDVQSYTKAHYQQKPIIGRSIGSLCDLDPIWRKGRPNRWVNGFGVSYFFPNGNFTFYNPIIIDGRFIWNGKIYDGGDK